MAHRVAVGQTVQIRRGHRAEDLRRGRRAVGPVVGHGRGAGRPGERRTGPRHRPGRAHHRHRDDRQVTHQRPRDVRVRLVEEAETSQPAVVEVLREVGPPGVGGDHDHHVVGTQVAGRDQRPRHGRRRRAPQQQALLTGQAPGGAHRRAVVDAHDLVGHGPVPVGGPGVVDGVGVAVVADRLDVVRAAVPAAVGRGHGVDADDAHRAPLLERRAGARQRAAGADARDEAGHAAAGLLPDLGRGGVVVGPGVRGVAVLVGEPAAGSLLRDPRRQVDDVARVVAGQPPGVSTTSAP